MTPSFSLMLRASRRRRPSSAISRPRPCVPREPSRAARARPRRRWSPQVGDLLVRLLAEPRRSPRRRCPAVPQAAYPGDLDPFSRTVWCGHRHERDLQDPVPALRRDRTSCGFLDAAGIEADSLTSGRDPTPPPERPHRLGRRQTVGANADGRARGRRSCPVGPPEAETFLERFVRGLARRGLRGGNW